MGCHPLYATIEHLEPKAMSHGFGIVCYHLNDVKGQLPFDCFEALRKTDAWKALMKRWNAMAKRNPHDFDGLVGTLKSKPR